MTGGQFLETERLTLRWLTLDDAALLLDVWNDPAFIRHVGDRGIRTLEAAQDAMRAGVLQLYETYDYGPFRLGLRTDETVIDYAGSGLGLERLIAIISPDNAASIGLIRKLGFEFERMHTLPGADKEVGIYGKSLIKKG